MITLMYHNLVARRQPDRPEVSYQVTVDSFAWQVGRLARHILDPDEANRELQGSSKSPEGFVLTFDDGAAGLLAGIDTLRAHQARAVVFICPGQLEQGLWCYRLAHFLTASPVKSLQWGGASWSLPRQRMSAHRALIDELQRLSHPLREAALSELNALLRAPPGLPPPDLRIADERMLRTMAQSGCFLFANHSWSHSNLAFLPPAAAEEEIDAAQRWLESSGLPRVPWFAFPHGGSNDRVVDIVRSRGLVPFGASARVSHPDVRSRVGIYSPDSRRWRFEAKLWWFRRRTNSR